MYILFCRHGETQYNLLGKYQGLSDSPLTEKGKEQAKKIGEYLQKNYAVTRFIISPLPRVKETCDIMNTNINAEVIVVPELIERSMGTWEGQSDKEIGKPELARQRQEDRFHFVMEGSYHGIPSESYAQMYERIKHFLENDISTYYPSQGDLVVLSHHGVNLAAAKYYLHLSDTQAGELHMLNDMIGILNPDGVFHIKTIS